MLDAIANSAFATWVNASAGWPLALTVHAFGTAIVDIELKPRRRGKTTKVIMRESPRSGPAKRLWNPALEAVTHVRNAIALKRLKRLAESRVPI